MKITYEIVNGKVKYILDEPLITETDYEKCKNAPFLTKSENWSGDYRLTHLSPTVNLSTNWASDARDGIKHVRWDQTEERTVSPPDKISQIEERLQYIHKIFKEYQPPVESKSEDQDFCDSCRHKLLRLLERK